ncbi:RnfABCDGE type electron transport complex subunit G [Halorhodospira halophila]|uniref:RnfABCDGE type electron transport complex subunit G n=1 Tax=Halorhodospira halophila TaxID=1053 RepID=UPI0019121C2A|nr:RnfABCDGE type electron transport complex subunit G [Halorhodospira halophila]MBK5935795.1 hypothetical protein [Halorhodospira halophila]
MTLPVSLRAGGILALFVGSGLAAVALVHEQTREQIATAERQMVLDRLAAVLPDGHDNAPEEQVYERPNPLDHATPLRIYPAYADDTYLGAAVEVETPEGYAGTIRLLVGIDADGEIIGVRPVAHRETPGLGDAIETARSDWIHGFDDRALGEPPEADWRVRQDGGAFDGITGATITARAVIDAVRAVLIDHAAEPEAYRGEAHAEDATAIDPEADDRSDEGPTG